MHISQQQMVSYRLIFTPSETAPNEREMSIREILQVFKASLKSISTCATNHCKELCSV